jgi:hypothetical protein
VAGFVAASASRPELRSLLLGKLTGEMIEEFMSLYSYLVFDMSPFEVIGQFNCEYGLLMRSGRGHSLKAALRECKLHYLMCVLRRMQNN